jgi:hypothetical protein
MAMMMFHDGQPFYTAKSLYGLYNQADFLRRAGAISFQCLVHTPALGTREYERTYHSGKVLKRLGKHAIPQSQMEGNYVCVMGAEPAWLRQLKLLGGYAAFYNPLNVIRAMKNDGSRLRKRRIGFQLIGTLAMLWTGLKTLPYLLRLMTSKQKCHTAPPPVFVVPVRNAAGAFPRFPQSEGNCVPGSAENVAEMEREPVAA